MRKRGQHIYHHLNSIDEDAVFVESSIASLRSVYGCGVPALGNRRNGTWYSGKFSGSVYFKSEAAQRLDDEHGDIASRIKDLEAHLVRQLEQVRRTHPRQAAGEEAGGRAQRLRTYASERVRAEPQ